MVLKGPGSPFFISALNVLHGVPTEFYLNFLEIFWQNGVMNNKAELPWKVMGRP